MAVTIWQECIDCLRAELPSQQFNTWIRPLHVELDSSVLRILAPNRFILDWVKGKFLPRIEEIVADSNDAALEIRLEVFSGDPAERVAAGQAAVKDNLARAVQAQASNTQAQPSPKPPIQFKTSSAEAERRKVDIVIEGKLRHRGALNVENTFDNFVEGKSNQLARAAAMQVAENPGYAYNPLFIYGGVGLGKTHLMHAIGNYLVAKKPNAKVVYLHSETFVATMVTALQLNAINEFKRFYRSVDALLIDDIQFFAGKERSQEEFFHTFNALIDQNKQVIISGDRAPVDMEQLEDRIKSRLQWGLVVDVHPTDYELRLGILQSKQESQARYNSTVEVSPGVLEFMAQRISSNVRVLEGALTRLYAFGSLVGRPVTLEMAQESLSDILRATDRKVTIDEIIRKVTDHYGVNLTDMLSARRTRSIARPRQVAMYLSKKLTSKSLPEIGRRFGKRDHTTVIHAVKKIEELQSVDNQIAKDIEVLRRMLEG